MYFAYFARCGREYAKCDVLATSIEQLMCTASWSDVLLSCRGVSLPRKLMNKAKAAGLRIREHKSGEVVSEFTHFVADDLVLSLHALIALAGGCPIVTTAWLHQSIDGGAAMPVGSLLLEDFQAEKKHKFIMKSSYDAARSKKLLQGVCAITGKVSS